MEIPVNRALTPVVGSLHYLFLRNPRGKFIIINNIPELAEQTKRFEHIFKEMYFIPEFHKNKTVVEIKTILKQFSEDPDMENYDAFVFMIVTHGEDERVLGYNACRNIDENDIIKISEVVDFVNEVCKKMETEHSKPKIVIFDNCRIRKFKGITYA